MVMVGVNYEAPHHPDIIISSPNISARLEMNGLRIAINSIALNHPKGLSGSSSAANFSCRFKSTSKTPKPSHHASMQQDADLNQTVVELSTLFSRVLAAFGILHVVTEYGCKLV